MMEQYPLETLRQACHGYIGKPLKDRHKRVLGTGIRTRIKDGILLVTYDLNLLGYEEFGAPEIEIGVLSSTTGG